MAIKAFDFPNSIELSSGRPKETQWFMPYLDVQGADGNQSI
jgi:hypothetical protein